MTEPAPQLTAEEIEELRGRVYSRSAYGGQVDWCNHCGFAWPCECVRILATIDSLRTQLAILQDGRCTGCMEPVNPLHPKCACVRAELAEAQERADQFEVASKALTTALGKQNLRVAAFTGRETALRKAHKLAEMGYDKAQAELAALRTRVADLEAALREQGFYQKSAANKVVWHAHDYPGSFDYAECNYRCKVARRVLSGEPEAGP